MYKTKIKNHDMPPFLYPRGSDKAAGGHKAALAAASAAVANVHSIKKNEFKDSYI